MSGITLLGRINNRHTLKASRRQLELQERYTMELSNYSLISGDESLDQSQSRYEED
jgi:hypothetical protein